VGKASPIRKRTNYSCFIAHAVPKHAKRGALPSILLTARYMRSAVRIGTVRRSSQDFVGKMLMKRVYEELPSIFGGEELWAGRRIFSFFMRARRVLG
jgi:hypothetical protein